MRRRHLLLSLVICFFSAAVAHAQQEYALPHIANGRFSSGSLKTSFVLVNSNNTPVNVTIRLRDDGGAPLVVSIVGLGTNSDFTLGLAAGGSRILITDGSGNLNSGSARVTATGSIGVAALFSVFDASGNFLTEAGVGNSEPLTDFVLPVDTTGAFNTGVALFNSGATTASLTLRLLDAGGTQVATANLTLHAGGHVARYVSGAGQLFPSISNFRGTLAVTSSAPVSAVTLRQNDSPLSYTSLPVVSRSSTKTVYNLAQVANGSFSLGSLRNTFL